MPIINRPKITLDNWMVIALIMFKRRRGKHTKKSWHCSELGFEAFMEMFIEDLGLEKSGCDK